MSTSIVNSSTPRLEVQRAGVVPASHIEVCAVTDPTCGSPIRTIRTGGGIDAIDVTPALPAGMYFWRARGAFGGVPGPTYSTIWQFRVPTGVTTATNTFYGTEMDWRRLDRPAVLVGNSNAGVAGLNGQAHIYRWNGSTMNYGSTLDSPAGPNFGSTVANAGDVNGDGLADLLVGDCAGAPGTGCDHVFVFRGNAGGGPTLMQTLDSPAGILGYGYALSAAGDMDGDGYGDIVVGAFASNVAYVYYGSARGAPFNAAPDLTLPLPACDAGIGACVGTNPLFGASVMGAADFNADRFADICVGAAVGWTRVFVYPGGARPTTLAPSSTLADPAFAGTNLGLSISQAHDVNNDGLTDIVMGGNGAGGIAVVWFGGGGTHSTLTKPASAGAGFGISVSGAGDTNGDGFGDVIVGDGGSYAYMFHGRAAGVQLATARIMNGGGVGATFRWVAGPGDLNADGFNDVMIGTCNRPATFACADQVRFCFGSSAGIDGTTCQVLTGANRFGTSVAWAAPRRVDPVAALFLRL